MPREYAVGGVTQELYYIGEVAAALDRKPGTLRKWEQDGTIPPATMRDGSKRRLYTKEQVEGLKRLCDEFLEGAGVKIPPEFVRRVWALFGLQHA